jgi:hypothetical protein
MERHPPWSDDLLRRWLIERAPPLTWVSIGGWAAVALVGLALVLLEPRGRAGNAAGVFGLVLAVAGAIEVLRGVLRMLWLALGGKDQPLRTLLRRRHLSG